jgi:hypothetical protein
MAVTLLFGRWRLKDPGQPGKKQETLSGKQIKSERAWV